MLQVEMPKIHKYSVTFTDADLALIRMLQNHYAILDGGDKCSIDRAIRNLVRDAGKTFNLAEPPNTGGGNHHRIKKKKTAARVERQRRAS